ncbi:mannose-1-phosphate guanylyltransferase/mannose-6-phosphate isomerase [Pontibacterium granulatum]|uniref:mannose-1-phosphate guanylyltransferase/mannose-6-phosphate isomerase n=1 Tax=Pontibacterium granulatum TaxID=2036029 RepID=UPI00249B4A7A|nr:mannose-1-phosphate guanylyltransferase/mannose-6-phosphate isomerase [Pontibacterium granulatum]MDI3325970.1 mannose-1-phosphate guanylyltransferase/mannose-6-phosphate isomerase [Pontibacterium granulatum]
MIFPVILSGGSGTRLWPLSRTMFPKQFLALNSDLAMLQETVSRLESIEVSSPQVICNEEHRFLVAEQMRQMDVKAHILLEPVGRNTAPAIALSALHLKEQGKSDAVMLVLAADHVIENVAVFHTAIQTALPKAEAGKLVTFGIVPTEPATGYGYIKGNPNANADPVMDVAAFVEKPDLRTVQSYLKSGDYFWNSGMFMFRVDRYLEELEMHRADILDACVKAMKVTSSDMDFIRVDRDAFVSCPDDSIDYAVMENTDQAVVVPLDAGWSDVGSWSALWDLKEKDEHNNVAEGDVILEDASNSFVYGQDRIVAALGVDNLVIVDTKDALLVAAKDKVQDVKKIVRQVKEAGRSEHLQHREVYRPWGKYDSIDSGSRYQVKHITVNPGAKLSLQKHHHRAEHWVVVKGTAEVRCGDRTMLLTEDQSTYIPLGEVHQLSNPGKVPLEIIEIQSGSYLGEDDIIRYEDDYGRN